MRRKGSNAIVKVFRNCIGVWVVLAGLLLAGTLSAQDITGFENGYLTFEKTDTNLYYSVEYRPNLTGSEDWAAQLPRNIKTSDPVATVPVGVLYRVSGSDTPFAGDATGNATFGQVLEGATFSTEAGTDLIGSMPNVGAQNITPGTTTQVITAGYHNGTGAVQGDADLVAGNIKKDVTIFGVTGTMLNAAVPKTGQTTSYQTGDDGYYEKGTTWPSPRFTVQANTNCVLDNLTGLIWTRNASLSYTTWSNAIVYCEGLDYGGQTDWRLPNRFELESLLDLSRSTPPLPSGHPFTGVAGDFYWSSSMSTYGNDNALIVDLVDGLVFAGDMSYPYRVWPVRGGE